MLNTTNPRLKATFERLDGRAALIPYITTGDPSITATVPLMHALVQAGADVIELGVPFSDPMADGPVIQRAAERAVARGVSLRTVLDLVAEFSSRLMSKPQWCSWDTGIPSRQWVNRLLPKPQHRPV